MAPQEITMKLGLTVGWRAKALLHWYEFLAALGFKVDVNAAAERVAAQMQVNVDGRPVGRLGHPKSRA
jgi:hypothetical protein